MANPQGHWLSLVRLQLVFVDWNALLKQIMFRDHQRSDHLPEEGLFGNSWCCWLGFEYQLLKDKWTG